MRLDHLLSKEHHETWPAPHLVGSAVVQAIRWMDSLPVTGRIRSGASSGAQTNKNFWLPPRCGGCRPPSTLLGFETTGPCFPGHCVWWEACCCPRFWWWGVVFDSWIVVASINSQQSMVTFGWSEVLWVVVV